MNKMPQAHFTIRYIQNAYQNIFTPNKLDGVCCDFFVFSTRITLSLCMFQCCVDFWELGELEQAPG